MYLMNQFFKQPSLHEAHLSTIDDRNGSSRNLAGYNTRNYIRLKMRARFMGSVEAAWSAPKYDHVKINPRPASYKGTSREQTEYYLQPSKCTGQPLVIAGPEIFHATFKRSEIVVWSILSSSVG